MREMEGGVDTRNYGCQKRAQDGLGVLHGFGERE